MTFDLIKKSILDALFPLFCIRCEAYGDVLCEMCFHLLPRHITIFSGPNNSIFLSACEYKQPLARELIFTLKYQGYRACAGVLAHMLYWIWQQRLSVHSDYLVVSVPLHHRKEKKRGFNQAELLARELARTTRLPYENVLMRIHETPSQTVFTKEERKENVSGAFAAELKQCVYQKNIILVDDVITTGSTLSEATKVLLAAGARQVYGLAVAHG